MVTFTQFQTAAPAIIVAQAEGSISPPPQIPPPQPFPDIGRSTPLGASILIAAQVPETILQFQAFENDQATSGFDWFERFHVVARAYDFGNLLSPQSVPFEVYHSSRRESRAWLGFLNNAGLGVEIGGLPSLPTIAGPSQGFALTLDVSTSGDAFVDTTLDFLFETGTTMVPIAVQRIVLFGLPPELPFDEFLAFLTRIRRTKDGTEKRQSPRKSPRQSWGYTYRLDDEPTTQLLLNLLFDYQARVFGVPVWLDDMELTADLAAGATTVPVNETAFRDIRVGGLVVILQSQTVFDVLEVTATTATTIDVSSPTLNSYAAGVEVFPLRTATPPQTINGRRFPVGLRDLPIEFESLDNDVDLANVAPFESFNGKVLITSGNVMTGSTKGRDYAQELTVIDGETGLPFRSTSEGRHRPGGQLVLRAAGRQATWELRGLAYALRGRQISFYNPTDDDSLVPVADLLNASNTLDVESVGFAQFVRHRAPRDVIRIIRNDGGADLVRNVTDSVVVSSTVDRLTVDVNWPATVPFSAIERIEFVEEVRFDSDRITLAHDVDGTMRLRAPIVSLFE